MSPSTLIGLFFLAPAISALYDNCDYYQKLEMSQTYYIYSPKYPAKYRPGTSCRFYAVSPPGTLINVDCQNIAIPPFNLTFPVHLKKSQECSYDRLTVSKTGSFDLLDGINYCGKGSIQTQSENNKIIVILTTAPFSPGGSFLCTIRAIPAELSDCECGWKNQERIVGGTEAGVNEYPMMAGLVDGLRRELFCGATIISNKFAVTAAHCLILTNPERTALLIGDHDISLGNETDSARLLRIDKFIIHPNYSTSIYVNDIALVRVEKKIQFNLKVGPACLPLLNQEESFVGEPVTALGWGSLRFGGIGSNRLMKVNLDVVPNGKCSSYHGDRLIKDQICTYKEEQDACQNDSGGPLLWKDRNNGRIKILGIISYGIDCATEHPSVNTRITSYMNWIRSSTGEHYCQK